MPLENVGSLVTDKILKFDQETCKTILEKIFQEQKILDQKKEIQRQERENLRDKLKDNHNKNIEVKS